MKKYFGIYHASESATKQKQNTSPKDAKEEMEPWMNWAKDCGTGLVDMGAPLGGGQKISKTGSTPSKRNVIGYSILQAENMQKAMAMLKKHPHLNWDASCEIEVHEVMPLPGEKAK
ncbi:MAG: hypothetical protein HYW50_04330 [Candidatus Diapherotrites archaeon]|nr:hypothetical protein [Candidatus Diapherotrites archaeon]